MHSRCCRGGTASRRADALRRRAGKSARSRLGMRIPEKAVAPTRNLATGSSHFQYLSINGETHRAAVRAPINPCGSQYCAANIRSMSNSKHLAGFSGKDEDWPAWGVNFEARAILKEFTRFLTK
jgi:hypothetical protein